MVNIVKDFPGVKALKRVDLEVHAGEVYALTGESCFAPANVHGVSSASLTHHDVGF